MDCGSKAIAGWLKKANFGAHAGDFGITENRNGKTLAQFKQEMTEHMGAPGTKFYRFNYRKQGPAVGFIEKGFLT